MTTESLLKYREFLKSYDILEVIRIEKTLNQKTYLGKETKKCRFCSDLHVTFKNDAHVLPQCLGNEFLLSHFECDTCNKHFGEMAETHFANFMQVAHAVSGTQGRNKKTPKYNRSGISLNNDGNNIDISGKELNQINDKEFIIDLTNPGFIPIAVYKCFTKMALSIMPKEELLHFSNTIKWIKEKQHETSMYSFENLISIYSYSPIKFPYISAVLLKRKVGIGNNIPYAVFQLSYNNFSFQTYLPLCSLNKLNSYKRNQLLYFPNYIEIKYGVLNSELEYADFNVCEKISSNITRLEIIDLDK